MTGEHEPDPVNLKETTLEVKRQNSSHKNVGLIVCQHINDSSSNNSLNNKSQMPFRVEPIRTLFRSRDEQTTQHSPPTAHEATTADTIQFLRYDKRQLPSTRSIYAPNPFGHQELKKQILNPVKPK